MTPRMWTTGIAGATCLALSALIASLLAGSRSPVMEAIGVLVSVILVLCLVHVVEAFAGITDDAQVTKSALREYQRNESVGRR